MVTHEPLYKRQKPRWAWLPRGLMWLSVLALCFSGLWFLIVLLAHFGGPHGYRGLVASELWMDLGVAAGVAFLATAALLANRVLGVRDAEVTRWAVFVIIAAALELSVPLIIAVEFGHRLW